MTKKKVAIFTGAGISKESGIDTFRDVKDGLWNTHKISDVATPEGWKANPELVNEFYNERRRQLPEVFPNKAHRLLAEMEDYFDVTIVTQNVDDLHERAGSTNILHLHGELTKAKSSKNTGKKKYDFSDSIDIGYEDIVSGQLCEDGFQMRPDIVWFDEYPYSVDRAYQAIRNAEVLLIIGTSLQIGYTLDMLQNVRTDARIVYIDPQPMTYLDKYQLEVEYVRKGAVEGVADIVNEMINEEMKKQ